MRVYINSYCSCEVAVTSLCRLLTGLRGPGKGYNFLSVSCTIYSVIVKLYSNVLSLGHLI